jgi:predicted metal-binding membrane protein
MNTIGNGPMMPPLGGLAPRDRMAILSALVGVAGLSWVYMWLLASRMGGSAGMSDMAGMAMSSAPMPWTMAGFALTFVMWWVMMVGMMLPSAAPTMLTFATVNRRRRARQQPFVATAIFTAGYLTAWGGFSLAATTGQWVLDRASLMSPMMEVKSPLLAGILLIAAGLFQFTPVKYACLEKCRTPLDFVLNRWREGRAGAFVMGLEQGANCLGCCWMLMVLMFVGGIMNLLWMAGIAAIVFVEKLFPGGQWIARIGGGAAIVFGAYLLVQ